MILTKEQERAFHDSGFLAIDQPFLSDRELARLRGLYDRMFAERAGRDDGNQFDLAGADEDDQPGFLPQIVHPDRYCPELRGSYLDTIHAVAVQLLGNTVTTGIVHAILKPAGIGAPTPWHQDEAYWPPDRLYRSVSIWMPLQDVDASNGCMWFNRGSHVWDVHEHRCIGGDPRVHGLELVDTSVIRNAVVCPLPAGGVTIHLNRTAHFAGPNLTAGPRRALIVGSRLPDLPYPGTRRFVWNELKRTLREERIRRAESLRRE
jgi:phytanoyl-CoA dioxygenase PhyH